MLLGDSFVFGLQVALAVTFMLTAMLVPNELPEPQKKDTEQFKVGIIYTYIRSLVFLFVSGWFWIVLAFESTLLNNCSGTFGQCFNTGSWVVTATVIPSSY